MKLCFRKSVPAENNSVPLLLQYFSENISPLLRGETTAADCLLCLDEAVTNIVMHSYETSNDNYIDLLVDVQDDCIRITLQDEGVAFTPETVPDPDVSQNMAGKRRGGFGIFLMKKLMDNFIYTSKNGKNNLSLVKFF